MRAALWVLDPALTREQVQSLLGTLAERGLAATLREIPEGRVVLVPDAPEGIERPAGVIRGSTVEVPAGLEITRKTFLDNFAVGLAVAALGTGGLLAGLFATPPPPRRGEEEEVDVGSVAEIEAKGSRTFRFGREPCVVVAAGGKFHALSTVCTHLGCIVRWVPGSGTLECPCHRASFDLDGNRIEGPPPRPLRTFAVGVRDGRVIVRRRTAS